LELEELARQKGCRHIVSLSRNLKEVEIYNLRDKTKEKKELKDFLNEKWKNI